MRKKVNEVSPYSKSDFVSGRREKSGRCLGRATWRDFEEEKAEGRLLKKKSSCHYLLSVKGVDVVLAWGKEHPIVQEERYKTSRQQHQKKNWIRGRPARHLGRRGGVKSQRLPTRKKGARSEGEGKNVYYNNAARQSPDVAYGRLTSHRRGENFCREEKKA